MIETPTIVQAAAQPVASIYLNVPVSEVRNVMGPGIHEVMSTLAAQGIKPAGAWLTYHHKAPREMFDFEICVPVTTAVKPAGRVKPAQLRAVRVAKTVYTGGYEVLGDAWGEFMGWIAANGHKAAEDLWEVYLAGPETGQDPSKWRTELNRPLVG